MRYLHTMVRVKDLGESLKFYVDLLGLTEIRRIENEKGRFTLVFRKIDGVWKVTSDHTSAAERPTGND